MKSFGFVVLLAIVTETHAFWRLSCSQIMAGRLDPIINPGTFSGHSHIIAGPINFNISSNSDTNSAAFCTSCSVQADKSAYWTPMMYYQKKDGTFVNVPNDGTVVYYLGRGENVEKTVPFPKGFRMVSGDPSLRSYDNTTMTYGNSQSPPRHVADRVSFACLGANYQNGNETYGMYNTNCPNGLRAQVHFPSCWNGRDLYIKDQSHVAYLSQIDNGVCPPTHPVRIPHLFFELYYFPNEIDTSDGGRFVWAQGDPTGFGFHGDFLNGWDNDVLTSAIDQCLVANVNGVVEDCPAFKSTFTANTAQNCPEQPSYYNEKVRGTLSALPGCNPVQPGPSRATNVASCTIVPTVNPTSNTLDGQKRVAPVPGTNMTTSAGPVTYRGCFSEPNGGRALNSASTSNSNMTMGFCASYCKSQGWSYFGTEFSKECWCGQSLPETSAPETDCNMACAGDLTQYCGAGNRLSVGQISGSVGFGSSSIMAPNNTIYMGCYRDNPGSRTLNGGSTSSSDMTYEKCASHASDHNMLYFGVEYSQECYWGNTISSNQLAEANCNMPCGGDSTVACGGPNAINIFNNTGYTKTSNPTNVIIGNKIYTYQQCITDNTSNRALNSAFTSSDTMTVESCLQFCATGGYSYAGMEWSRECFCNNVGPSNGATTASGGENDCNMACSGNKQQFCGGSLRLNLYKLQSNSTMKRRNF